MLLYGLKSFGLTVFHSLFILNYMQRWNKEKKTLDVIRACKISERGGIWKGVPGIILLSRLNEQSCSTHVKISQLVASLQTSRQQVVFARLVTSCQQVWNKLLTSTCNNLVDIIRLVTRLFQQGCYNHDITILLQPCVVNLVTFLLYHDCIRLVRTTL